MKTRLEGLKRWMLHSHDSLLEHISNFCHDLTLFGALVHA